MKLLFGMYLTFCLICRAQITTSITSNSDGRLCVTITNHSKATLTAYFASWAAQDQRPGHTAFQYHDSLIGAYPPIPPGGTGILTVETTPPEIHAAVFDDGSTYGDPAWVRMILSRRGQWLAATEAALKDLETGTAHNIPQAALAQQLTVSRDAQIASHRLETQPPEADAKQIFNEPTQAMKEANLAVLSAIDTGNCIRNVYHVLITNIQKFPVSNGSPLMLSDVLSLFTKQLNQQKAALLASKPSPIL